jgi:O-antigen/teichoic acid export membrane protein
MSRLSKNIVYNGVGQGLSVLLSFVAVRLVYRKLGGDALGLIYFSLAFGAVLSLAVQLGICDSAVREVASHHTTRPEYIKSFIRTSSLFYWIGYIVLAVVAYVASPPIVYHWIKLESLDGQTAIHITRILTLGALLALPRGLYRALLAGLQHMGLMNLIDVVGKAVQQGGIFVILLAHGSLYHVAYWIAFSTLLPVVVYWVVCTHFFSVRALLIPGFSSAVVKQNMHYAAHLIAISICSWVLMQADKVIISKLLPLALLGVYTVARGAINQGMMLTGAINSAIFPHFSALHGSGKLEELKRQYSRIHDLICFGTVPIFAAVPFAAIPVFSRVFDMPTARLLVLPSTFLCIGYYMNGALTAPYVVSLAVGRPDITARQNFAALFVVAPASAIAIYWFGLDGAGFSWVLYHLFAYSYGLPTICRDCLGIPARAWYVHLLKITGPAVLIYGCAWIVRTLLGSFSLPCLIGTFGLATVVYCVWAFRVMSRETRHVIIDFLKSLRPKRNQVLVAG